MLGVEAQYSILGKEVSSVIYPAVADARVLDAALCASQWVLPEPWKWSLHTQYAYISIISPIGSIRRYAIVSWLYVRFFLLVMRFLALFVAPQQVHVTLLIRKNKFFAQIFEIRRSHIKSE